jgi:hypothetical protein
VNSVAPWLERSAQSAYGLPLLILRDGEPFGLATNALGSPRVLNGYLLAFFREPEAATLALAMYVRHLFWSFPVQRLYTQFPLVGTGAAYLALYEAAGFQSEGVLRQHALIAGRPCDVGVLGSLRPEFEQWWSERDGRLAL